MAGRGLRRTLTISDQSKSDFKRADNESLMRALTISDQSKSAFKPSSHNDKDDHDSDDDDGSTTGSNSMDNEFCRSFGRTGIGMPSPVRGGRTLMDIIREEQKMSGSGSGSIRNPDNGTINWKSFKDRIRLRRAGTAWSEPEPGQELKIGPPSSTELHPNFIRAFTVRGSNNRRLDDNSSSSNEEAEEERLDESSNSNLNFGGGGNDAGKTSLMDLFDGFGSFDSDAGEDDDEEEEEEEEEDEDVDEDNEELYHACCVCMVRHKGAAFIPCGHTFCRLCSRELWVSRGNCPLCNGFILEILDIF